MDTHLKDLAERLHAATGPDRDLDAAVLELVNGAKVELIDGFHGIRSPDGSIEPSGYMPKFTASIDAAVTLEVKGLEEVVVRRYSSGVYVRWTHCTPTKTTVVYGCNHPDNLSPTEPLARCLARVQYELSQTDEAQK